MAKENKLYDWLFHYKNKNFHAFKREDQQIYWNNFEQGIKEGKIIKSPNIKDLMEYLISR